MTTVIIHKSITAGTPDANCGKCKHWGADIQTPNGMRKAHGNTTGKGLVKKECAIIRHLAIASCVCDFFNK